MKFNYKLARQIKSVLDPKYRIGIMNNPLYRHIFDLNYVSHEYAFNALYGKDNLSLIWQEEIDYINFKRILYTVNKTITTNTIIVSDAITSRSVREWVQETNRNTKPIKFSNNQYLNIIRIL